MGHMAGARSFVHELHKLCPDWHWRIGATNVSKQTGHSNVSKLTETLLKKKLVTIQTIF